MKKLLILSLAALLIFGTLAASCKPKPSGADANTLIVGLDDSFPPMGYDDANGQIVGFDIDLAKAAAKKAGMDIKLQPIAWDSKDSELDSGNINCIWNGFSITDARKNSYEWTSPYMKNRQIMVVLDSSSYTKLSDLAGKSIAVQDGSSANDALDSAKAFKDSLKEVVLKADNQSALMELQAGAVQGVLMDEVVARYNIEKLGAKLRMLDESLADEVFGVAFKKGNSALRDKIEGALKAMADDGTMAKISKDWFGEDVTIFGK